MELLHERLNEYANDECGLDIVLHDFASENVAELLRAFASEIEASYVPLPRFKDGTPLRAGNEIEGGVCHSISVYDDGQWYALDEDGNPIQEGASDVYVAEADSYQKVADYLEAIIDDSDELIDTEWTLKLKEAHEHLTALIERS